MKEKKDVFGIILFVAIILFLLFYPRLSRPFELSDLRWTDLPDSECFSRIGYSARHEVLGVVFENSDPRIYLYYDFPKSEWKAFVSAESWGGYYNAHIKGQYKSERID